MRQLFFSILVLISANLAHAQKSDPPKLNLSEPLPANLFVELARIANPSVVNISTTAVIKNRINPQDPFFDFFQQFYGMQPQAPRLAQSLGTGFLIREDGLIVTNNHVVDGADTVKVQLVGSEAQVEAKVIGSDSRSDIALIKIKGSGFPTLSLGSSKDTQVGEWVAAIGNPFGNAHTMTKGIISAKGRDIGEINKIPLLQTDAPINPGNSGGPLINAKGLVIGVNSAIDARAQGIGFAIPIDEVKALIPQLEKLGHIRKGYLGVGLANLDPQTAAALGLKDNEGAAIAQVERKGPADKAGIKPYDVIKEFNNKKIKNTMDLQDAVADSPIGKSVKALLIREGKPKTVNVTVVERPEMMKRQRTQAQGFDGKEAPFNLGLTITDPNPELLAQWNLPKDIDRPIVVKVAQGSPAALAGFSPGDIILDVNKKETKTAGATVAAIKKGTNTFRVARQGAVIFFMMDAK